MYNIYISQLKTAFTTTIYHMTKFLFVAIGVLFTQFGSARYVQDLDNAVRDLEAKPFSISTELRLNRLYAIASGVSHDMAQGCKLRSISICR